MFQLNTQKAWLSLLPLLAASCVAHAEPQRGEQSASQASSSDRAGGEGAGLGVEDTGAEYDGAGEDDGLTGRYDGEGEGVSVGSAVNAMPDRFIEQPLTSADGETIGIVQQVLRRRSDKKVHFLVSPATGNGSSEFVVSVDDLVLRGDLLSISDRGFNPTPYASAEYVNLEEHVPCGALC